MDYSTASTADAVYIIGGWTGGRYDLTIPTSTIARFSDGFWSKVGDLKTKVRFKLNLFSTLITYFNQF